jgi:acylphosphatase
MGCIAAVRIAGMKTPVNPSAVRRRLLYSGQVQGVGFRFTACQSAADFAVAGYVRNLRDGQVEVVAEGAPAELDAFQADLAERMAGYIARTEVFESPPTGEFSQFEVWY